MRDYGFTALQRPADDRVHGFHDGKPVLDFQQADAQMRHVKELGFRAVITLWRWRVRFRRIFSGHQPDGRRRVQGLRRIHQGDLLRGQDHARRNEWIPVYFNLADEPSARPDPFGRKCRGIPAAFPKGPPYFTAASSFTGNDPQNPHFRLSRAFTSPPGTITTKPRLNCFTRSGGLGLLQRWQPMDIRHLYVQSREAIRHEVPPLVALERRGRVIRITRSTVEKTTSPGAMRRPMGGSFPRSSSSDCVKVLTIIGDYYAGPPGCEKPDARRPGRARVDRDPDGGVQARPA